MEKSGAIVMPWSAVTVEQDIPFYLIAPIVKREVNTNGEQLERVIVRKTRSNFFNVCIRTRPIHRELMGKRTTVRWGDAAPTSDCGEET